MIIKIANRIGKVEEYYFSRKLREIALMQSQGIKVINLGIGSPDLNPPKLVIDALVKSSHQSQSAGYQSYRGVLELRIAFAKKYQIQYGVTLDPDAEILPLMGSKEGIMHLSMAFLEPGDEVLVPNPGYPAYAAAAKLAGAKVLEYPLTEANNWLPDMNFLKMFSLRRVKIMWLNYPHMPTGASMNSKEMKALVDFAKAENILLCHDNPYSFILNDNPTSILKIEGAKEVAIELNSLSKSHNMAGFRVGMIAGKKEYVDAVLRFKSNMDSGMYLPIQKAAIAALNMGDEWYQELNNIYRKRRIIAWQIMDSLGCVYDKDRVGLFIWARIPDGEKDAIFLSEKILKQHHVFITPGSVFGTMGNRYLRLSLTSDERVLAQALQRIKEG